MAGMNIGGPRYPTQMAPGGPQSTYYNPVKQAPGAPYGSSMPPPMGNQSSGQPMGNFPQRSSNYSNQSLPFGGGSTSSNFSEGPPSLGPPGGHPTFAPPTSYGSIRPPMASSAAPGQNVSNGPPMATSGGPGLGMPPQNVNFPNQFTPQSGGMSVSSHSTPGSANYGPPGVNRVGGPPTMGNQQPGPPNMGGPPMRDSALSTGPPSSRAPPAGFDPQTSGPPVGPPIMSKGQYGAQSGPSVPQMGRSTIGAASGPPMGPPIGGPPPGSQIQVLKWAPLWRDHLQVLQWDTQQEDQLVILRWVPQQGDHLLVFQWDTQQGDHLLIL